MEKWEYGNMKIWKYENMEKNPQTTTDTNTVRKYKNSWVGPFKAHVGNFWAPWCPFWILQEVRFGQAGILFILVVKASES